jgi:general secretion pathway protein A
LLVAGTERTDIFSLDAIQYIYRCSEGIPRQINNLCDNALLAGFAAGEACISREIIEEVANSLDMLPRMERHLPSNGEESAPARILTPAGRAELWAAGNAAITHASNGDGNPSPLAMREDPHSELEILELGDSHKTFRRTGTQ